MPEAQVDLLKGRRPARGAGWLSGLLAVALVSCGTAPPRPDTVLPGDEAAVQRHVQALVQHEMRAHDVTGLSVALVDDQRVVWAFGSGWADQAAQRPAGADTVYRMGSISKLFTTVAALQLVDEGRLALDAPIEQALPGFRIGPTAGGVAGPITPRMLMTHHAGLPRDLARGMWGAQPASLDERVAALAAEHLAYPPGLVFEYSNVGFTVLGAAVQARAGQPFEACLQARVLQPLGMRTASFSAAVPVLPEMSRAYAKGREVSEPALSDVPAGGLNASVLDMAQFIRMLFAEGRSERAAPPVLQPASLHEMWRVQNDDVPLDLGFRVGLGWMYSMLGGEPLEGGGPVAHHAGATMHFRSQMVLLPQHRLGVIVAANSDDAGAVVNRIALRTLALALQAKTGIRQHAEGTGPVPAPWSDPPLPLTAIEGDYTTQLGLVRVRRDGAQWQAEVAGRRLRLEPQADGEVALRYRWWGLVPVSLGELDQVRLSLRRVAGRELLVARIGTQALRVGERLPPVQSAAVPPAALVAHVGRYRPELAPGEVPGVDEVRVSLEEGRLLARVTPHGQAEVPVAWVLQPVAADAAVMLGTLASDGELMRLEGQGAQATVRGAGYRWHRLP